MRGTALVSHLSLWPLFVLTVTKVMLAKSVNQTVMCLHANSPTTGHNLSIYHQHVSDHIANVHEIPSQSTQQQQFPITNPSTTLFCQLNQPVPPALAWTFCSMPIWVSDSVKGQEKYKRQEQKFESFGGNLSLLQNQNMQFSTFRNHIRIHEAGIMWEWHFEAHLIWNWADLAKMVKVVSFNDSTRKGSQSPTPITYGRIYANFVGKHSEHEAKWQWSAGLLFAFSPQEAKSVAETGPNCQLSFWKPQTQNFVYDAA